MKSLQLKISRDRWRQEGQGLVEFALILMVIMGMCAGMLYVHRLLTIQYWAQQDARMLAFENEWVAQTARDLGRGDVVPKVTDNDYLHRPWAAKKATSQRNVTQNPDQPGMNDLLAYLPLGLSSTDPLPTQLIAQEKNSDSLLLAKIEDDSRRQRSASSIVELAHASQNLPRQQARNVQQEAPKPRGISGDDRPYPVIPEMKKERGFTNLLHLTGFGGRYCHGMQRVLRKHGIAEGTFFHEQGCSFYFERDFAHHLAVNLDVPDLVHQVTYQMENGLSVPKALQVSGERMIAREFYSYFDQKVKDAQNGAVNFLSLEKLGVELSFLNSDYLDLATDMRYVGSIIAMGKLADVILQLGGKSSSSRNVQADKALEDSLTDIVFDDDPTNWIINGYWMTVYNLIPIPDLSAAMGGLFDGIAYNVFAEEGAADEISNENTLIRESSIFTRVSYDAANLATAGASKRFDTTGKIMDAKFYLLTQPWHISRRDLTPGANAYRDLGDQLDDMSKTTEEAVLRRRVFGLYVFPSEPTDFLRPISGIIPELDPVLDAFDFMDSAVGLIKDFVFDNPLNDILDFISELPLIDLSGFKLPEFPAVRPQAYPHSTEIENDRLAGSNRDFDDYIKEQKDYNPEPNPEFDD